jgi:broad specificity phosphatase PhoE
MKEHSGKTVFVAAHHSVNKAILTLLLKKQWSEWQSIIQHNACLNILSLSSLAEVKLELLGCVAHLPE